MAFRKTGKRLTYGISMVLLACAMTACGKEVAKTGKPTSKVSASPTVPAYTPTVPLTPTLTAALQPSPTKEPTVEVTPTPTLAPTATPTPKPEEYFVTVGKNSKDKVVKIGSNQYYADIRNIQITNLNAFKEQLGKLPNLLYIDMCNCGLTNAQMEDLTETFPNIRFVWMLHLSSYNANNDKTCYWHIRTDSLAFSTLHEFADPRIEGIKLENLRYCQDLVALDIGHNNAYDTRFMEGKDLHVLITVDNYNVEARHYLDDLSVLATFPNLMYLEIFVGDATDLSGLSNCKEIVDLNISYNPVSDITPLKDFPKLERMVMEHTNISQEDFEELCELYPFAKLVLEGEGSVDQGWRTHPRYADVIDMFKKNYWNDTFRTEEELKELAEKDLLLINGERYYGTPYVQEMAEGSAPEGIPYQAKDVYGVTYTFENTIQSTVGKTYLPRKDQECNFYAVGNAYSTDKGDGRILVLMEDGLYHWFYKNEVIARTLIEKLDENGEIKEQYRR